MLIVSPVILSFSLRWLPLFFLEALIFYSFHYYPRICLASVHIPRQLFAIFVLQQIIFSVKLVPAIRKALKVLSQTFGFVFICWRASFIWCVIVLEFCNQSFLMLVIYCAVIFFGLALLDFFGVLYRLLYPSWLALVFALMIFWNERDCGLISIVSFFAGVIYITSGRSLSTWICYWWLVCDLRRNSCECVFSDELSEIDSAHLINHLSVFTF